MILDDKTVGDLRIYGLPPRTYPLYLAFLGDIDGEEEAFLNEAGERAPATACARSFHAAMDSRPTPILWLG